MSVLFEKDFCQQIKKNDYVKIIGRDEYKGYIGIVTGMYKNPTLDEPLYLVELQATGKIIQREKSQLKRYFYD